MVGGAVVGGAVVGGGVVGGAVIGGAVVGGAIVALGDGVRVGPAGGWAGCAGRDRVRRGAVGAHQTVPNGTLDHDGVGVPLRAAVGVPEGVTDDVGDGTSDGLARPRPSGRSV